MFIKIFKIVIFVVLSVLCFVLTSYANEALLNTTNHISYLESSNGRFRPDDALTRSEAARMFYSLLNKKPDFSTEIFSDLEGSSCEHEANVLGAIGIFTGYGEGEFHPQNTLSRAEFAEILKRFFPNEKITVLKSGFSDVSDDYWGIDSITFAAEKGFINGYPDGTFCPEENISRAETAIVMNKVLSRYGDKDVIGYGKNIRIFLDVPSGHWAFFEIMEAATGHEYESNNDIKEYWVAWLCEATGLEEGFYNYDGELYYIDDKGQPVRGNSIDRWSFNWDGKYITWNEELDAHLTDILRKVITDGMAKEEKRRALYEYIRDNYAYLKKPLVEKGAIGWQAEYAVNFFNEGVGNCFSFEAAYGYLLRKVGYEINFAVGTTGSNSSPHGWVEIIIDGEIYIDDPEIDMSYRLRGNYKYNFYNFTYKTAPWAYRK